MDILKKLFSSKKFLTFLVGTVLELGVALGLNISEETKLKIMESILVLGSLAIGGFALADFGKEAAAIKSNPATTITATFTGNEGGAK